MGGGCDESVHYGAVFQVLCLQGTVDSIGGDRGTLSKDMPCKDSDGNLRDVFDDCRNEGGDMEQKRKSFLWNPVDVKYYHDSEKNEEGMPSQMVVGRNNVVGTKRNHENHHSSPFWDLYNRHLFHRLLYRNPWNGWKRIGLYCFRNGYHFFHKVEKNRNLILRAIS